MPIPAKVHENKENCLQDSNVVKNEELQKFLTGFVK